MAPQEAVTRPSEIVVAWRDEAVKAGCKIECIAIAFETGRDGFWLERQSSICRAHQRNMRHWSIDAKNASIHLLVQRRGPDSNQLGRAMLNPAGKISA
jgi:hypothetical protein